MQSRHVCFFFFARNVAGDTGAPNNTRRVGGNLFRGGERRSTFTAAVDHGSCRCQMQELLFFFSPLYFLSSLLPFCCLCTSNRSEASDVVFSQPSRFFVDDDETKSSEQRPTSSSSHPPSPDVSDLLPATTLEILVDAVPRRPTGTRVLLRVKRKESSRALTDVGALSTCVASSSSTATYTATANAGRSGRIGRSGSRCRWLSIFPRSHSQSVLLWTTTAWWGEMQGPLWLSEVVHAKSAPISGSGRCTSDASDMPSLSAPNSGWRSATPILRLSQHLVGTMSETHCCEGIRRRQQGSDRSNNAAVWSVGSARKPWSPSQVP